jgi:hypothetical protein
MHGPLDVGHAAAMALTAAALSGACNALWLRKLEDTWPGTGTYAVVSKSLADYFVCAPLVLSGYLVVVPLLTLLFGGTLTTLTTLDRLNHPKPKPKPSSSPSPKPMPNPGQAPRSRRSERR